MNRRNLLPLLLTTLLLAPLAPTLSAAPPSDPNHPFLSPLFSDHMVLQRDKPNTLWGWTTPGATVTLSIDNHTASATAGPDGKWQATLQPPAVGGPYTLTIDGPQHVQLSDLLVGDVWLCGGQSNMELPVSRVNNAADEIKSADHPQIRFFKVANKVSYTTETIPHGTWTVCSPETAADFSALACFFGERLNHDLHIPIGLVEDCVGGTPIESWMRPDTLATLPDFKKQMDVFHQLQEEHAPPYGSFVMHWYDQYDKGVKENWNAPTFDDSSWKPVQIPSGAFAELGVPTTPAVCWFRRTITLPDPLPPGKATLYLGSIEQMDTAWVNGQFVGASSWVENPRVYGLHEGLLKPGQNSLVLRVFKIKPNGGFLSPAGTLKLEIDDNGHKTDIPLAGEWKGALSVDARPPHPMPLGFENWPTIPTVLYRGMIEPIAPLALTGALWYQGEQNAPRGFQYRTLMPALIADWRKTFDQGDFPFYIVSLPRFMDRRSEPGSDGWTEVREAQILTAQTVPNTGVAITVDTGDASNIHPGDKRIVGNRLALVALAKHYGEKIDCEGPTYQSMEKLPDGSIKIHFTHTAGGLVVKGDKPAEFSIAGADRHWHWADAKLDGDSVIVSSKDVPNPVAVRYAWQANPEATLYNGDNLPAVPFRTDDWPAVTENNK